MALVWSELMDTRLLLYRLFPFNWDSIPNPLINSDLN